jgi:hypothetical protein
LPNGQLTERQDEPRLTFEARHGIILDCQWTASGACEADTKLSQSLTQALKDIKIHEQRDWAALLSGQLPEKQVRDMASFLTNMFPYPE